jgi:D-alanine-D-alanine ligase
VLESLGIPFVGSTGDSCRLSFDKPIAKSLVSGFGVNTPASVALPHSTFRELGAQPVLNAVIARIGLPLMVKPTKGGSALGASVVHTAAEFPSAMVGAFAYSEVALMEHFVAGTEISVCVYDTSDGPVALPAVEIVPPAGIYDYNARYTAGTTEFFVPARLATDVAEAVAAVALEAHSGLGLRDWSRTDLIVDESGTPWFLEVNVAPGMTETSLFPQALSQAGVVLGDLARDFVLNAISRRS